VVRGMLPRPPVDTHECARAARQALSAAAPMLWIKINDQRSVSAVRASPVGVNPNADPREGWVLVGECHSLSDAALERAILRCRSTRPRPRAEPD
jgi:hypothetical protein